jgi:hypothetical protein
MADGDGKFWGLISGLIVAVLAAGSTPWWIARLWSPRQPSTSGASAPLLTGSRPDPESGRPPGQPPTFNKPEHPGVSKVVPNDGPAAGHIQITVWGSGFTGATRVTFGGNPAISFDVRSDSQLVAILPPFPSPNAIDARGYQLDVAVCTAGGCSPQYVPGNFTYRR